MPTFIQLKLTAMASLNLGNSPSGFHETPIKTKNSTLLEPKTADSGNKKMAHLQDIDPEELFEQFDKYVRISADEDDCQEEHQEVERKLNYQDSPRSKLIFSPRESSMKKKQMVYLSQNQPKFESIVLFEVTNGNNKPESAKEAFIGASSYETPKGRAAEGRSRECWATLKKGGQA